jgi:hypothetical protein
MRILAEDRIKNFFPEISTIQKRKELDLTSPWVPHRLGNYGLGPRGKDRTLVIAEMDPCVRMIRWGTPHDTFSYQWQMPRLILMYCDGFLGVTVTNDAEWSPTSILHAPPLPNVYSSGKVCQPRAKNLDDAVAILFGSYFDVPLRWWQIEILNDRLFKVEGLNGETRYGRAWNDRLSSFYEKHPEMILNYEWPSGLTLGDRSQFKGTMIPFIVQIASGDIC